MVKPIPDGYSSITPYLIFEDAGPAIDFYGKAFGAQELFRMPMGDRIAHAEILIGNSRIMLADEAPQMDAYGPKHHNGSPVSLMLYVDDVDAFTKKAVASYRNFSRSVRLQVDDWHARGRCSAGGNGDAHGERDRRLESFHPWCRRKKVQGPDAVVSSGRPAEFTGNPVSRELRRDSKTPRLDYFRIADV